MWLIEPIVTYFAKPLANWGIRKSILMIDLQEGQVKAKKITEARENGTQDEYDSSIDDIFH